MPTPRPVLAAYAALLVVDVARLSCALRGGLALLALLSLAMVASRHVTLARAVEGLEEVTRTPPPPGVHGGLSLSGLALSRSKVRVLEHLPQWWTARHGGVGHHFFADADHQPVRFVPGGELPALLVAEDAPALSAFTALLVYGEGPLPPTLSGFRETARAGRWRRLERAAPSRSWASTHAARTGSGSGVGCPSRGVSPEATVLA